MPSDASDRRLTFADFAAANRARCESALGFNHEIDSWSLSDWFTAVLGELGEAANVAKKLNRVRDGIPGNKLSEAELRKCLRLEVADVYIYLDLLAQHAGFTIEDAVRAAFDAKSVEIGYPYRLSDGPAPVRPYNDRRRHPFDPRRRRPPRRRPPRRLSLRPRARGPNHGLYRRAR